MSEIKNLLENVDSIQKKYEEIAEITGEKFNIFSILKMDSREVRTHSAFIGELLNPEGVHGLRDEPLKIFQNILREKFNKIKNGENEIIDNSEKFDLDLESSFTTVEKYIGSISEDKKRGGRIDIIVECKNKKAMIIENKIYAIEQENQLIRYKNFNSKAPILYLTLQGDKPISAGDLKENIDYFNISYAEDIVKWLELCIKESVDKSMLREVLKQYIYLIKKLTNQSTNKKMGEEIVNRMRKEIKASFEIAGNLYQLKKKIYEDLIEDLKNNTKGYKITDTDHIDFYGLDLRHEGFEPTIRILFGKRKDKEYCCEVSCGFQINGEISESQKWDFNLKGFEVDSFWVYKWINSGDWLNFPERWENAANGKVYNEIMVAIEEIIGVD